MRTAVFAGAAIAASAALNVITAKRTERRHPARGRFIDVGDTRVHYTVQGEGPPIVLLHGNGVTATDWSSSGVVAALAKKHRVFAFDRPGFGYSSRSRTQLWTPAAQASVLHEALNELEIGPAIIVGHSWGTLVALALAFDYLVDCNGLVLISGYYFPTFRPDAVLFGAPALPVAGDLMRYTISPPLGYLMSPPLSAQLFTPAAVSEAFTRELPMSLRPWQLRANAEDAALMLPAAATMQGGYANLQLPVTIIAGSGDKVVSPKQSQRLADEIPGSRLLIVDGAGHMVHYSAADAISEIIAAMSPAEADWLRERTFA